MAEIDLEAYRARLKAWRLTALRLSSNGRFIGYDPKFISWVEALSQFFNPDGTTSDIAVHELIEAKRRIELGNDDLFPEICDRLDRALVHAKTISHRIPETDWDAFEQMCNEEGINPNKKIIQLIQGNIGKPPS